MKESFFLYKSARGSCGSDVHKMSISIRNARDMDIRHELYRETISAVIVSGQYHEKICGNMSRPSAFMW